MVRHGNVSFARFYAFEKTEYTPLFEQGLGSRVVAWTIGPT
jgi:hypothetical protein